MKKGKLGATGKYPRGSLGPGDEGEVNFAIGHDDKGNVIIDFNTPVAWFGMPPELAVNFARII